MGAIINEWSRERDKYGRTAYSLDRIHVAEDGTWTARERDVAVLVTLPTSYEAAYGHRYLVNVRGAGEDGRGEVTEYARGERAVAKSYAERRAATVSR